MNHLSFTREEFQAIWSACRPLPLKDGSFILFRYFLIESLQGTSQALAQRVARLSWGKLRRLRSYLSAYREKLARKK